ncbi:MAG: Na/Pi cotransporter family protein [Chitinispirillaceae bacterium]
MNTFSVFDFFSLLCGLALFLYGMQQGEKNLRYLGGHNFKKFLKTISHHRLSAYLAGFSTTVLTQSSSATTVMLVGLASARLMTFGQSLGMILGSDLGTTLTVQLFAFKVHEIAPLLIAVGFFSSLSEKSEKISDYGKLILSFGFIFFGMNLMAQAVTPLRSMPLFEQALLVSFRNPWWGIIAGSLFTAIIQSSAATLAITIALAQSFGNSQGWSPGAAELLPLVLGANLGTCVTAFISTFRADVEGIRVAWSHFFFKVIGAVLIIPVIWILKAYPEVLKGSAAFQIASLHTIFNLFISVIFLPALGPFEKFIFSITRKAKSSIENKYHVTYIHENVAMIPVLALSQAVNEISRMGQRVARMNDLSCGLLEKYDSRLKKQITEQDNEVDFLHEKIVTFLTRISHENLSAEQAQRDYQLVMVTTDLEHIGDIISKQLVVLAEKVAFSSTPLSEDGKREIIGFFKNTDQRFKNVMAAFTMNDIGMADRIFSEKRDVKRTFQGYVDRHMDRLYNRHPESLQTTSIHVDLLEEIQRINHFSFRIAAHVLRIHRAE